MTFVERTLALGARVLPPIGDLAVRRVLHGVYDTTPDRRAILGPAPGFDGLFVAAGFSGRGYMIAPAVGKAFAAAICMRPHDLPLEAFSLSRFAERADPERLAI